MKRPYFVTPYCAGHGVYRAFLGRLTDDNKQTSATTDSFGDVLISVTGVACTVDRITLTVLLAGKEGTFDSETLFCFIFDCCR